MRSASGLIDEEGHIEFQICAETEEARSVLGVLIGGHGAVFVGDSAGWLRVFVALTSNAKSSLGFSTKSYVVMPLCQQMHNSAIKSIKLASQHKELPARLLILFENKHLLVFSWNELLAELLRRVPEHHTFTYVVPNPLIPCPIPATSTIWTFHSQRHKLDSQQTIRDITFSPCHTTKLLDQSLLSATAPATLTHSSLDLGGIVGAGSNPIFSFYSLADTATPTTRDIASTVMHTLFSWLPGSSSSSSSSSPSLTNQTTQRSRTASDSHDQTIPSPVGFHSVGSLRRTITAHSSVIDGARTIERIECDPVRSFAVASDKLGRLLLLDTAQSIVVRQWKGYRDAQWCFCHFSPNPSALACMVVLLPRRGVVEIWPLGFGSRIAATTTNQLLGTPWKSHDTGGSIRLLKDPFPSAVSAQCMLVDLNTETFVIIDVTKFSVQAFE